MTEGSTPTRRNPLEKAREAPVGASTGMKRRLAVAAKCWECMGGPDHGVSRRTCDEIRMCTSPRCPLFGVRPYR